MSEIIGIYSNLAALSVTFTSNAGDTVTVTCKDLDELRLNIDSAYCPIRQLLPIGNETEGQVAQLTFGRSQELTWRIVDLFFYKTASQGGMLAEAGPDLVRYMAAYEEMIRTSFQSCGYTDGRKYCASVQMLPAIINWPLDSDRYFFGVSCILTIRELVG